MTLTEFLLARVAEDETFALNQSEHWSDCRGPVGEPCTCIATLGRRNRRRVAEYEAKRRIIAEHAPLNSDFDCRDDGGSHAYYGEPYENAECRTLQLLALPYAEHPDYRPEWAPDGMVG